MARNHHKNKEIPKSSISRSVVKEARIPSIPRELKPSWRFSTVDRNGNFAWPIGEQVEIEIINKLRNFDSMKWSEIEGREHHYLTPSKLSKEAIVRLKEIHKDDSADLLFSFHLGGKERIICIRENNVGKLLWYDPKHDVCLSHKKNT